MNAKPQTMVPYVGKGLGCHVDYQEVGRCRTHKVLPGDTYPEVQTTGINGPTKRTNIMVILLNGNHFAITIHNTHSLSLRLAVNRPQLNIISSSCLMNLAFVKFFRFRIATITSASAPSATRVGIAFGFVPYRRRGCRLPLP